MINKVVSVCCIKDLKTWKVTSRNVMQYIDALEYFVIVPDAEVEEFVRASPDKYKVVPESSIIGEYNLNYIKSKMPNNISFRAGWYLQQFIKIEFFRNLNNENCLIWDADTVPIKQIQFIDSNNKFLFYKGVDRPKFHQPYFDLIKELLGMERIYEESFISQCFPLNSSWIKDFCETLEARSNEKNWIDAVMNNVDHSRGISGFSEYESLGVFISNKYNNFFAFKKDGYFTRNGTALVGFPDDLYKNDWSYLCDHYDFIGFEEYEKIKIKGINIGCGNDRKVETFKGNIFLNVDLEKYEAVDMIMDVEGKWPFPNNYFEQVVANNIIEHVDDVLKIFSEIDRCLEIGGLINLEVPFIGSYNHGTDVTHKRGLTFQSFNFLLADSRNYLFREKGLYRFNYKIIQFFRENIKENMLVREYFSEIPSRGTYADWIDKVNRHEIPGTFGYIFQKVA
jgi:SAM-dependent methyltransferase